MTRMVLHPDISPEARVAAIDAALRPLADAARAEQMQAYLLNRYDFLGLPAPVRRAAVVELNRLAPADAGALLAVARLLWAKPEREFRYTAIDLLRRHVRMLDVSHLAELRELLQRDPWWETVDGLAAVIGAVLHAAVKRDPAVSAVMDAWVVDADFWVRRAAMLHQLGWRLETDAAKLARHALQLAGEREFFIRKAIGWALRDYARWNPGFVRGFVDGPGAVLSALSIREACKRL